MADAFLGQILSGLLSALGMAVVFIPAASYVLKRFKEAK